jgi:hypothetical protein
LQVEEHVFKDTRSSTRSIRLFLTTLNSLRQCFIHSGMKTGSAKARECPKVRSFVLQPLILFTMSSSSHLPSAEAPYLQGHGDLAGEEAFNWWRDSNQEKILLRRG